MSTVFCTHYWQRESRRGLISSARAGQERTGEDRLFLGDRQLWACQTAVRLSDSCWTSSWCQTAVGLSTCTLRTDYQKTDSC